MPTYTVQWLIELDADSPREAAIKALEIQRDPNSTATHFTVIDEEGDLIEIDDTEYEDCCANCEAGLPPDHDHCPTEGCDMCLCPACFAKHNGICQDCYDDIIAEG
jgi:hypothetical protein